MRLHRGTSIVGVALATVLVAGGGGIASASAHGPRHGSGPDRIGLPAGFQPEGIEIGRHQQGYVGSRANGDIYRFDLRTGRGKILSGGPGTPSLGLKLDGDHLLVAGGTGGDLRVLDARSGALRKSYQLATGTAFINDLVVTRDAVYVTDSANARLFAIERDRKGRLGDAREVPLTGQWQQVDGNNGNGIATTPDGRALLVVNSAAGVLYRVDPATGDARAVDLQGYSVSNGDGLLREGRTLFVVQNRQNKIAELTLSRDGLSGRLSDTITSPLFDVPSTVARAGTYLYLPNARFTTPATPTTTYDVVRVKA